MNWKVGFKVHNTGITIGNLGLYFNSGGISGSGSSGEGSPFIHWYSSAKE